ncbi:UbiA family prenyltransferase [Henriciella mobilis]|uniref:UbiA family prenyltransferase n=1 Tax=Henriciella mobilis TaxID=2305467 RepID=A0A399RFL7_9PROT|nr:UbiA family prenyltransferase [Henriciella mobilis]RIJ28399.1 UbiA family prenyltransferase [Henriciella mobilis]
MSRTPMSKHLPLIVDLDGTLLVTDTLAEGFANAVLRKPLRTSGGLLTLLSGRAAFKRFIHETAEVDIHALPERADLLPFLRSEKARGRSIYLVTAATQSVADEIFKRYRELLDGAYGSSDSVNLKGRKKRDFLLETFPDGFVYAGDSKADLAIWEEAGGIVFAGASKAIQKKARSFGKPVEQTFENKRQNPLGVWLKALRLHQWSKNFLLFAPLFLSGQFMNPDAWGLAILGFFLMGMAASGTYLLNDLLDLSADRRHRTKRNRPLAAGDLFVLHGLIAAPLMIAGALAAALYVSVPFGIGLLTYLGLSLSYSFGLKRVPMLDVSVLAALFSWRVALGAFIISQPLSEWLLTFSVFFFFSLSMAKRHVEVASTAPGQQVRGRGYYAEDAPLTLGIGLSTAAASIVIMVLFLAESAFKSDIYVFQGLLWAVPVLIGFWLMRIWLLAHRGELHDDPVSFAVRDRISLGLGLLLALCFAGAVFLDVP